jgi:hypothetical protein
MARDIRNDRDDPASAKRPGARGTSGAQGTVSNAGADPTTSAPHVAKAHGRPARVDESLPATRPELLALHAEARKRRAAAALGSEAFRAAVDELARIEIRIADVDRAQDPTLG